MSYSIYDFTIPVIKLHLRNVAAELKKAQAHAQAKNLSPESLIEARLIEDMNPLAFQVQIASNTAKGIATRVAGHKSEIWADDEKTFEQLQQRIAKTLAYLDGVKREEFEDPAVATKVIELYGQKFEGGLHYVNKFAMPNFMFHVSMVYAILRSNGVDVGKRDFLTGGELPGDGLP